MPSPQDTTAPANRSVWLRRVPVLVIAVAAIVGALTLRDELSFDALARNREALLAFRDAHYIAAALGFVGLYIAIVALSLPGGTIASLAGGVLFGIFPGVALVVVGAGTGALLVFLAVRSGFGEGMARKLGTAGGKAARLQAALRQNEWSVLFLMRLVPLVPFVIANIVPALVGTSLWRFAVSTYLGIIPGALVFTSVGSGLGEVFARGEVPDIDSIVTPSVLLPLLGLAALAALPMVLKAMKGKR